MNIFKLDLLSIVVVALAVFTVINMANAADKPSEFSYTKKWCDANGGNYGSKNGVHMSDGTYADCITAKRAVEFDFCHKWAECAGQAQNYAVLTNKKALCVLICRPRTRDRYVQRYRRSQHKIPIGYRTELIIIEQ